MHAGMPKLVKKVSRALDHLLPQHQGKRLGVAISGGPDSVALCSALVRLAHTRGLRVIALHVNHRLRPEADAEQGLVANLCQHWQIPCLVEVLNPLERTGGIEAWSRSERYQFFQHVREQENLDAVALAHTLDDQAETVLFRLLRGSARRGLTGIPPTRGGWLIRPLLDCTRREVKAYLTAEGLPYAVDTSNADLRYSRNKIRHLLLPFLEREFSPRIRDHLVTFAKIARAEEEWLDALAHEAYARVVDSPLALSLSRFAAEPPALRPRILRHWLEQSGHTHDLGFAHIESVWRLSGSRGQGTVALPGHRLVRREGDILLIEKRSHQQRQPPSYRCLLTPGQTILLPHTGWRISVSEFRPWDGPPRLARSADRWQALFDGACLSAAFFVRSFHPGDRIRPLGMRGHRKVHDVLIDAKIPVPLRRVFPLFVVGQEIAWVPGCVRGEKAKVTPDTRSVCQITVSPLPEK